MSLKYTARRIYTKSYLFLFINPGLLLLGKVMERQRRKWTITNKGQFLTSAVGNQLRVRLIMIKQLQKATLKCTFYQEGTLPVEFNVEGLEWN